MRKRSSSKAFAAIAILGLVAGACGGDDEGDGDAGTEEGAEDEDGAEETVDGEAAEFTLFGKPTGAEGEAVEGFLAAYNDANGTDIEYSGAENFEDQLRIRVEGGDPPVMAFTPQPSSICSFQEELVSVEDMGFDIAELEANHSKFWMDLTLCEDGNHYGLPWFPNYKSIIFYHQPTFEEQGYEVPETWDDLVALSSQAVADGFTPWCMGFESGANSGWPGTDWIEDIMVRQAGAETYAQWFNHEIPFNDPAVVAAFDTFGEIMFGEGFVLGGADAVGSINFGDSPGPLFQDPPGCLMLKQGSFIQGFFEQQPEYEAGEEGEISVFPFPSIDGNPGAMGGGDTLLVFDGSPEYVQIVKDWLTPEWQCTLASENGGGVAEHGGHGVAGIERLPGHKDTDPACFDTDAGRAFATSVTEALGANTFAFDASDLMVPAVGQGTFWTAMVEWTQGKTSQEVTDNVENSWPEG